MRTTRASGIGEYLHSISPLGRITADQEASLARRWREQGSAEARERLITANLRLVVALARRSAGRGIPVDDLIAEGNIGLIQAVDRFDPAVGCRFSTYATYWIRQSIGRAFAAGSSRPAISERDRTGVRALDNADSTFASANGRAPTSGELAALTGWSGAKVLAAAELRSLKRRSIDADPALSGSIADPSASDGADTRLDDRSEAARRISGLLEHLTPDERRVIDLHFGLGGDGPRSARAVAEITQQSIRTVTALIRTGMARLERAGFVEKHRPAGAPHEDHSG